MNEMRLQLQTEIEDDGNGKVFKALEMNKYLSKRNKCKPRIKHNRWFETS